MSFGWIGGTSQRVSAEPPTSSNPVAALLDGYREVFSESLGTIMPFHVKLSVTPEAKPHFFKPRPVRDKREGCRRAGLHGWTRRESSRKCRIMSGLPQSWLCPREI